MNNRNMLQHKSCYKKYKHHWKLRCNVNLNGNYVLTSNLRNTLKLR